MRVKGEQRNILGSCIHFCFCRYQLDLGTWTAGRSRQPWPRGVQRLIFGAWMGTVSEIPCL